MKRLKTSAIHGAAFAAAVFFVFPTSGRAQQAAPSSASDDNMVSAVRDLQEQVRQLRMAVDEMRAENVRSRAEMQELRQELQATRSLLERPVAIGADRSASVPAEVPASTASAAAVSASTEPQSASSVSQSSSLEERVQKLEESTSLLGSKVDEQHQTKVESASKYRARLSGIVLMNAFRNLGASDNLDFPTYALPLQGGVSSATMGATLRQSQIGLEVFGPMVAGARTSANVQFDFAGGFPYIGNGTNFGLVRLQTASLRLDWEHTSVVAGQDSLFMSPLSPTSFTSLAVPAFGFAGNLWAWTPQLRVEHRFSLSDQQTVTVQAGVLDNLDWEFPSSLNPQFNRSPQAGELSGQPGAAVRTSWSRSVFDRPLSLGVAGYYGRQNWNWGRYTDAWSGMADAQIPLTSRLTVAGEFYRGRGIGGFGAGVGRTVLYGGDPGDPATPVKDLDVIGGWSQIKLQLTSKLELNGAVGEDNSFAGDVRGFAIDANNQAILGPILGRNRGALGNFVYRPRSDLLFSAEFRRLRTFPVYNSSNFTNQVGLALGILF